MRQTIFCRKLQHKKMFAIARLKSCKKHHKICPKAPNFVVICLPNKYNWCIIFSSTARQKANANCFCRERTTVKIPQSKCNGVVCWCLRWETATSGWKYHARISPVIGKKRLHFYPTAQHICVWQNNRFRVCLVDVTNKGGTATATSPFTNGQSRIFYLCFTQRFYLDFDGKRSA